MQEHSQPRRSLPNRIWLEDVEVRLDSNEIVVEGTVVRLKPKAMQVLQCLVSANGGVLTNREVLDQVWPNLIVSASVLTEAIHELRRAFRDESRKPRFIQTVQRRGYRMAAEIKFSAGRTPRVAVLPFASLSHEPDDRYFCDGLSEELINGLGRIRGVEVVARTSSFRLAESEVDRQRLAERLDATHLVSGSLRRVGNRIRVVAYLIDSDSETEIWSTVFDRLLGDLIAVQDEIAGSIARAIAPQLEFGTGERLVDISTSNLEAYREFSTGRYLWKQFNYDPARSMQCYRQALDLDPDFALPHVGMVECYNTLAVFHLMPQRPAREASIKHAEQALFLDPHSADTQFAFGYTQFYMHWNWRLAEMAFDRALATNPNHVLALCFLSLLLCALQRWEESHRLAVTATRLDPFSPLSWSLRSVASFYRRDPGDALAAAEHGLELNPEDLLSRWIRADSVVRLGPSPRALDMVHDLDARTDEQPLFNTLAGVLYGLLGERSETLRIWEKLKSYTHADPFLCSLLSVHLHDPEEALDHLEQTESEGEAAFYTIGCLPYFDPLRRHPRFVRLLERLGLDGR